MSERDRQEMAAYLRRMAASQRKLAIEFDEAADRYDGRTAPGVPADGHTWRVFVECRGSHKVVGETEYHDAPRFAPLPTRIEVRTWDLNEALILVAGMPLSTWFDEEDD